MANKELVAAFKAPPWKTNDELERFLIGLEDVGPQDVLKVLETIIRTPVADANANRLRTLAFTRLADGVNHKGLFTPYVQALKAAKDGGIRTALVNLLPKVNNIAEHAELCALLRSPELLVRQCGAAVLRKIGGKTVFQLLSTMLQEADFAGRIDAIDVLVQTAGHHAIGALQAALVASKPPERIHILKYLGDPKFVAKETQAALQAISALLRDPTESVVVQALVSFGNLCSEDQWFESLEPALESAKVPVVTAALGSLKRFCSARVVGVLERKLRGGPNAVRYAVLEVLEAIGNDEVLPAVVAALGHKQLVIRTRAGDVLSNLSRAGRVDLSRTIVWLLRSTDENVRRMAVELARTVKDPDGNLWPKLLASLRDEDWWVRERVVDALVEMAGKQLTRHIVSYLQDPSDVVRRYAVDVLIRVKDPGALGALVRTVTGDSDWWAREKAVEAIGVIGDERAIPYLVDAMQLNPDLRICVLETLGQMSARAALPQIAEYLSDEEPDVRLAAIACLRKLNDPKSAEAVRARLADLHPEVRIAAKTLLMRWDLAAADGVADAAQEGRASALDRLLLAMAKSEADDLILASGRIPLVKRLGKTVPLLKNALTAEQVKSLLLPQLSSAQQLELAAMRDVDFSYEVKTEALRFRANVFNHTGGLAAVFRIIKGTIPKVEELGLPRVITSLGELSNGLVLVGGPTGSGKSTTLAALVDLINRTQGRHIISLEDPIEAVHKRVKSLVTQREIGTHTRSFASALRSTLREDPDVILVGEMRDLATISFAVTAAETGHLVFGTIHTVSTDTSIDRLINSFPALQQDQVRGMLSESLRAVVCQYLLRRKDAPGRKLALEVMLNNEAISSMIRKGKCFQIPSVLATSNQQGMQLMDQDLLRLVKEGSVHPDEAFVKARSKKEFEPFLAAAPSVGAAPPSVVVPSPRPAAAPPEATRPQPREVVRGL